MSETNPALTWQSVSEGLFLIARTLYQEWGCGFPTTGSVPDTALNDQCDVWALRLANNLTQPLNAPPAVRPWLLARLTSAVLLARLLADSGVPFPEPTLTRQFVARLLIEEWHDEWAEKWQLYDPGSTFFSE